MEDKREKSERRRDKLERLMIDVLSSSFYTIHVCLIHTHTHPHTHAKSTQMHRQTVRHTETT